MKDGIPPEIPDNKIVQEKSSKKIFKRIRKFKSPPKSNSKHRYGVYEWP